MRGYDDSNTPDDLTDDRFYVNDPYTNWIGHSNGENREFDYATISSWFNGRMITFNPALDKEKRKYSTIVDTNKVQLDNIDAKDINGNYIWREYYGASGNWRYSNEDASLHSAKWAPNLPIDGIYEIHAVFNDNEIGEDIKYEIFYPENSELPIGMKSVKQENGGWKDIKLGTFYLKEGSYVKINDVPSQANIDAVRFEYISPPKPIDLILLIDTTGSMSDDIAEVKSSASEIVQALNSKGYDYRVAVADYRDFPFGGYGDFGDYPYKLRHPFSDSTLGITFAIYGLSIGNGADWRESVYTALVSAMKDTCKEPLCVSSNYGWRKGVNKAIILMGDAPPHITDPYSVDYNICPGGCTIEDVDYWSTNIDPVVVYSVAIGSDPTTYSAFSEISERTGGKVYTSPSASDIVDTIIEVIGDIGDAPNLGVSVDVNPKIIETNPGESATYSISVTNIGSIVDSYNISIDPQNFAGTYRAYPTAIQTSWMNLDKTSVEVMPTVTETASLAISVPNNWAGMEDVIYPLDVTAKSTTDDLISNMSSAEFKVKANKRSMIEYSKLETIWLSELIQSSSIHDGIKNSLLVKLTNSKLKLEQALLNIDSGNNKQANNMLSASQNIIGAFINQVEAQYDKKIMQPDAEMLKEKANKILQDIESAKKI